MAAPMVRYPFLLRYAGGKGAGLRWERLIPPLDREISRSNEYNVGAREV